MLGQHPEGADEIEEVLTTIYQGGDDDPKWQALDDGIREIIARKNRTLIERLEELCELLSRAFDIEWQRQPR